MVMSTASTLASYAPISRMYHMPMLFPAFRFEPSTGAIMVEHRAPTMMLISIVMALIWGTLAMVFIVPSWAGVMVTNITKIVATLWISDAVCSSASELEKSVSLLLDSEPCVEVPKPFDPVNGLVSPRGGAVSVASSATHMRSPLRRATSIVPMSAPPAKVRLNVPCVCVRSTR